MTEKEHQLALRYGPPSSPARQFVDALQEILDPWLIATPGCQGRIAMDIHRRKIVVCIDQRHDQVSRSARNSILVKDLGPYPAVDAAVHAADIISSFEN